MDSVHRSKHGAASVDRAVIIAPHHADVDLRVRRTIGVIEKLYGGVDVYWDGGFSAHQRSAGVIRGLVEEHYVEPRVYSFRDRLRTGRGINRALLPTLGTAQLAYVHASGIEGILLAREIRKANRNCAVVFDYHDSLFFELYYQLHKLRLGRLFPVLKGAYRLILAQLSRGVTALVGISENQIVEFRQLTGFTGPSLAVPNVRAFAHDTPIPVETRRDGRLSLVWFGHVMPGRDVEQLAAWVARASDDVDLHVFGEILDPLVAQVVTRQLEGRVYFYGGYASEEEIATRLPGNAVGVFLGWADPYGTGINGIASPNKYYTYVNLGLPILVHSNLSGLAAELRRWRAGEGVVDADDFTERALAVQSNYDTYAAGMKALRTAYASYDPERELSIFLKDRVVQPARRL
jgi:hypothetical protein